MEDSAIIELLKKEPKKAVAEILAKYGSALLGVIQRIVGSREVAEDVLQDTFVKIWKNAASYHSEKGSLLNWLMSIARNTALDLVRTKKYQKGKQAQPLDKALFNTMQLSEEMYITDVGLLKAVDQLDRKTREIIYLLYLQGCTQIEVSKTLDLPLGTVKTRARQGIRQLRVLLKK